MYHCRIALLVAVVSSLEPRYGNVSAGGSTIGGGTANEAVDGGTVAGGSNNRATGISSFVGGGFLNEATGQDATVPGARKCIASGGQSFAAGDHAKAANSRSFVWNDGAEYHDLAINGDEDGFSSNKDIADSGVTGRQTFHASARNGFRFVTGSNSVTYISGGSTGWATTSTRAAKTNIDPVDSQEVLAGVEEMEVSTWEYKDEDGEGQGTRHIGPMAEDFHEAVDVGDSDEHINSINADGVAFAAIQGLSTKLDEKDDRIDDLEAESERKDERIEAQQEQIDDLEHENEQLRGRLTALENRLADLEAGEPARASADD